MDASHEHNNHTNHSTNNYENDINYVILDCDIGTDDAWALLMLIKAEQEKPKNYKILGVTCVAGNTNVDNVAINTLRILDTVNRLDIPVFKGSHGPILPPQLSKDVKDDIHYFHGVDGFGDLEHKKNIDPKMIQKAHAVNAMYDFVCKYPEKVTFILVGPLTNFAMCLNMYSDFAKKVKNVFIMGGNIQGVGNATRTAEFNFFMDPEAAHIVLEKSTCPLTILPWEACLSDKVPITMDWRLKVLGACSHNVIKLLTTVEEKVYVAKNFTSWIPCDAIITALFLFPDRIIKKDSFWHATVELSGRHTRGQMVLDHLKNKNNKENVRIIEKICCDSFKEISLWTADL